MLDYLVYALGGIAGVATIALLARRHARGLIRERRIRIDRFKLRRKHAEIRLDVFSDPEVIAAIRAYAKEHHIEVAAAERQAHLYLTEIVPKFNLLAYYRVGAPIAKLVLHFLYRVVVERQVIRELNQRARKGTVVVYMINHRSNADYLLVAHMLFKFISLSYAVGEWARVWPLNHLFKWFGAYFIRRRFREPLYHAVLGAFVRTITKRGVTQGVFIEGGLTRDGAFLKPKLGMLDSIVSSRKDPAFTASLVIVPTAINYDRTLEDRILIDELSGADDRSTRWEKLRQTSGFLFKNILRSIVRRFKRFGYAIVTFGEPIDVDSFAAEHPDLFAEPFEARKSALRALAELTMTRISSALPITPVPLVASVFAEASGALTDEEIVRGIERRKEAWLSRVWLTRERTAAEIWRSACEILEMRRLIEPIEGRWRWSPAEILLRDYYANSLLTFDEVKARGWRES
ncbi:MAG TPA: 1-acyl-sn-glycerol-3-phosphate acyltransferase [Thermoanaerobaculia bacterium]